MEATKQKEKTKSKFAANSDDEEEEDEEYDPYKVPLRFVSVFTPQELDSTKQLFQDLDADGSGSIDMHELGKLFVQMEEEVSTEELEKMMDEVDDDESGEIEYAEFLALLASFKKDGSKFSKFTSMMDDLHSTPMAELIRQARKRRLAIDYKIVKRVQATSMSAEMFVAECKMTGEWIERIDGKVVRSVGDRIYQGIDKTTRDAKMAAATAALTKLKEDLPGIVYDPGVIPNKWNLWLESNLTRGVDPEELLQTLVKKGFVPAKNEKVMQRISMHVSFERLREAQLGARLDDQQRYIPPEWLEWAENNMKNGITGDVILETLVKAGFRPDRNPHLAQLIRTNRGSITTDPVKPRILDFWDATEKNDVEEVRRYLKGGQDPNERRLFEGSHVTALEIALKRRHVEMGILFVSHGYDIEQRDYCGRTALLNACMGGSLALVEFLVAQKADFHAQDRYGDYGIHLAAQSGHLDVLDWLLDWQEERLRRYLSGGDVVHNRTYVKHVDDLYEQMMTEKLKSHETRMFPLKWVVDAAIRFREEVDGHALKTVIQGAVETRAREKAGLADPPWGTNVPIHTFVEHIDPRETARLAPIYRQRVELIIDEYGPPSRTIEWEHMDGSVSVISTPITKAEFAFLIKTTIEQSHVNLLNTCGRTPLFKTVDPPTLLITQGHVDCANNLLNEHQADTRVLDEQKLDVNDIVHGRNKPVTEEEKKLAAEESSSEEDEVELNEDDAPRSSTTQNMPGGAQLSVVRGKQDSSESEIDSEEESDDDDIHGPFQKGQKLNPHLKFMRKPKDKLWFPIRENSRHVQTLRAWSEYHSEEHDFMFYFQTREAITEINTTPSIVDIVQQNIGWSLLREKSEFIQHDTHGWMEYEDTDVTGEKFYYYPAMRKSQWNRPVTFEPFPASIEGQAIRNEAARQIELKEKMKTGWAKLSSLSDSDWLDLRSESQKLRSVAGWDELRHQETAALFYYHSERRESLWDKPKDFFDLEKRKYAWHLVTHMDRHRWQDLLDRSESIRQVDEYQERREERNGLIFYYNEDQNVCDWAKPQALLQEEQHKFGNEVGGETIDDWERVSRVSTSLRKMAGWEEFRNEAKGVIFYLSLKGFGGSWMKPDQFARAEKRQHGFELFATQTYDDYKKLRSRSKLLRSVDPWEEWRDEKTGVVYYFHKHNETTEWRKPAAVKKAEAQRNLWIRRYEASKLIEKVGPWEIRQDKNATSKDDVWWTNIESCSVFNERPSAMDEEDRRQKRKFVMMRTQTMDEWAEMHKESDVMRGVGPWEEMHHRMTGALFYFNADHTLYQFEKPKDLLDSEREMRGHELVLMERPEDWRRLRENSTVLRRQGDWEEYLDDETKIIFYFNSTSVESMWQKPETFKEMEFKKRGWYMVNKQTKLQWDQMIQGSTLLREVNALQEYRHRETLATFYHDIATEESCWDKPSMLMKHDRDSLAPEMGGWSDREWGLVRMRSEKMRRINSWHELRDSATSAIFYYNDDTGHYQLNKPEPVLKAEKTKRAWTLVRKQKPDDWKEMRSHTVIMRKVLHYQELKDETTNCIFYFDTKSPIGQCQWHKPTPVVEHEKIQRAWQIVTSQPPEDWMDLRLKSQEVRHVKDIYEFREPDSGITFYYDEDTDESFWEKPEFILEYDNVSRGWHRILNENVEIEETHCDGKWDEMIEERTSATFYINRKEFRCLRLPFCQWDKPQDIIDVEEAERERIKEERPVSLYKEFMLSPSNWDRIIERSELVRNKPELQGGWVEYCDNYSGIHFYHYIGSRNTLALENQKNSPSNKHGADHPRRGEVMLKKPHAIHKYDRKMFFWAVILHRSLKMRTFARVGWVEYLDVRMNEYYFVHPEKILRTWRKPDEISATDEKDGWAEILEDVGQVLGFENRGPSGWKVFLHKRTKQEVYHHKHFGCTWIKPQGVIDDSRALQRKRKELEKLETDMNELERNTADAKRAGGTLLNKEKLKEKILEASAALLDDDFESEEEDEVNQTDAYGNPMTKHLTQEEKAMAILKRRRAKLALVLEQDDAKRRAKRKKANMKKRATRLGHSLTKAHRLKWEIGLFVEEAAERKNLGFQICTWGCGEWLLMEEQKKHVIDVCPKRMLPCDLHCGLFLRAEFWEWAGTRQVHEENECVKRLVLCPQNCKKSVVFEDLEIHCQTQCAKRRIPPLHCRLGCGKIWIGGMDRFKAMMEEREDHEKEECGERNVQCDWVDIKKDNMRCMAEMKAKDLRAHRQEHVKTFGISYFRVHGQHTFVVPRKTRELKFQLWGGGGGGGHLLGSNGGGGNGGGGGYIEGILEVTPGETLDIVVGEGGGMGVHGVLIPDKNRLAEAKYDMGIAYGGQPGGGNGYASNTAWAAGGGGGFTSVFRNGPWGKETIFVAGGGGGGGSRNGCPGGGFEGGGTADDPRNGQGGTQSEGGEGGHFPLNENWSWDGDESKVVGEDGKNWQGGNGSIFGAGGGGGFYGGGGGGSTPGIVGGGGGGSSFAADAVKHACTLMGQGYLPGGIDRKPPTAIGLGEWDPVEGHCGQGGPADEKKVERGRDGACIIRTPGFYKLD